MNEPWVNEPDQHDWEAHGLRCAMRRGPGGHWCGYVGVPDGHPLHRVDYSARVAAPKHAAERTVDKDRISIISLFCADAEEARQGVFPLDVLIEVHGGLTYSAEGGKHLPSGLWWLGFDCAHSGDCVPKYRRDGTYRDFDYTVKETESLAKQLADWPAKQEAD